MPDPWVAIEATIRRSRKMTALPNDTARYGFIVALGECKLLYQSGAFTPGQWAELLGRYARYLTDYTSAGLVHEAPAYCAEPDCMRSRGPFPDGYVVVHNWPRYQREHAARQAAYEARTDAGTDVRSDVVTDVVVTSGLTVSRAGASRAVAVPVYSHTNDREPYQVPDSPRARSGARHMAYQRGEITGDELSDLRAADAVPVKRAAP